MRFKLLNIVLGSLTLLGLSCAEGKNNGPNSPKIGVPLQEAYSVFTGSAGTAFNANEAVFLDDFNRTVTIFQIEPFAVSETIKLSPSVDAEAFFAGKQNQFFVLKEKNGFGVLKRNGQYLKNPVPMFGKLTSVSYDATSNRLVLQDDFDSVALLVFDDAGNVISSWIGGPIIDGNNAIVAGTLLENGVLSVSLSNKQLALIDFDASIAAGKWEFTAFDLQVAEDLLWFSPVFNLAPVVIARTDRKILTIDINEKRIIDSLVLTDNEKAVHFNRSVGHVIVSDRLNNFALVHSDEAGKLIRKKIHNVRANLTVNDKLEYSIMDQESGTLTVMASRGAQKSILRNRLSDGLYVGSIPVTSFDRTIVTAGYMIEVFEYRLGKALRTHVSNPDDRVELSAYNIQLDINGSAR